MVCGGDSLLLFAASLPGYNYQWQRNGVNVTGATAPTYFAKLAGAYRVKITAGFNCTATSGVENLVIDNV